MIVRRSFDQIFYVTFQEVNFYISYYEQVNHAICWFHCTCLLSFPVLSPSLHFKTCHMSPHNSIFWLLPHQLHRFSAATSRDKYFSHLGHGPLEDHSPPTPQLPQLYNISQESSFKTWSAFNGRKSIADRI
jgi:hypothetical protein